MLLPARCDEEGNYYVRFFHGTSPQKEPIYKFDKDGVKKTVFSLPPAAEFQSKGTGTIDFAVARSGELYLLAAAVTGNHIVKFDKTGEFKSNIKLENDFNALRFDVFDSGTLLVSGVDRETSANLSPHAPYTGIFDQQGKLLKKVVLAEDKQYEEAADRGDSDFFDSTLGGGGNFAVERGSVVRGSDGNMYVVRWTNPAKVYAISATGEVIRSFDVTPELERKKPAGVREHAGRLAIEFPPEQDDPRSIIKVVGLDGKEHATYDTKGLGAVTCYSAPERFTFFTADGKDLKLNILQPK
jgi:hypothetical protein